MLEANKFANMYQSSFARWPCRKCLVLNDNLNNTNLTDIIPRTPTTMKQVINSNDNHCYSIHSEKNAFWNIRYKF